MHRSTRRTLHSIRPHGHRRHRESWIYLKDAFKPGSQVIVLDDVLATGGTLEAAIGLCADGGAEVLAALCVIELDFLNGAKRLAPLNVPVVSLLHF